VPEFYAEAPRATASEGLVQGPYVAAIANFESATLCTKGAESTNAPPRPTKGRGGDDSYDIILKSLFENMIRREILTHLSSVLL